MIRGKNIAFLKEVVVVAQLMFEDPNCAQSSALGVFVNSRQKGITKHFT